MERMLSEHFSLSELTLSQTAERRGLDNAPSAGVIEALTHTAYQLEAVRTLLGCPILVSSGYRSAQVNAAVGGTANSAHTHGWAADFIAPTYGDPLAVCRAIAASTLQFDQVIQEGTWVHVSFAPAARRQLLTKTGGGYAAGIAPTPEETS